VVDRIGAAAPVRYHSIAAVYCDAEAPGQQLGPEVAQEKIREALLDSVRHHLVADVPVGAFLSGGVDSGALVGLMRDAGQSDIQTVTLAFEEFRGQPDDEAPLAAETAKLYGARHTIRCVTEQEFRADLPRILEVMDQPTIDGINTWFASKAARELGLKVGISGLGGDELFGGYPSFRDVPRWVRWLGIPARVPLLGKAFRYCIDVLGSDRFHVNPKAAGLVELGGTYAGAYLLRRGLFMPWEIGRVVDPGFVQEGLRRLRPLDTSAAELHPRPRSPFARVATLEACLYMRNQLLRDTDWASMAHSLEVRVPLVDATLLNAVAPLTTSRGSLVSKATLARSPRLSLPQSVATRRKTGFTTPVASWLQKGGLGCSYAQVPFLAEANCPWSRRWAYGVAAA
jgi:asparagine synthase (glutamine-hydrolysing)